MNAGIFLSRFGGTRLGVWMIKHLASPLQRWIYQRTGGHILTTVGPGRNVLLLTTKGRLTGKERTTPVFYLRDHEATIFNPQHSANRCDIDRCDCGAACIGSTIG